MERVHINTSPVLEENGLKGHLKAISPQVSVNTKLGMAKHIKLCGKMENAKEFLNNHLSKDEMNNTMITRYIL